MKKLLAFSILLLTLVSCENRNFPNYSLYTYTEVPDSNKQKYADFIIKGTQAADQHLSTSDYEDPEDVIEQLEESGERIYSVEVTSLLKEISRNEYVRLSLNQLTKGERIILDSLMNK